MGRGPSGKTWAAAAACLAGAGCSSIGAPVLRHQTGESLGEKHFRFQTHAEMSRTYQPQATSDPLAAGVTQQNSVFQGVIWGFQAEGGALPRLDLELGANFTLTGGGWRAGFKYQLWRNGRSAVALMSGISSGSGSGNISYLTASTPENLNLILQAWVWDISFPASFRVSPWIQLYGGPMFLYSAISGSAGSRVVSDSFGDWGMSLGLRVGSGMFFGDLEGAEVLEGDPFTGGFRCVPYGGISLGISI